MHIFIDSKTNEEKRYSHTGHMGVYTLKRLQINDVRCDSFETLHHCGQKDALPEFEHVNHLENYKYMSKISRIEYLIYSVVAWPGTIITKHDSLL